MIDDDGEAIATSSQTDVRGDIVSERGDEDAPNIPVRARWFGAACTEGDRSFADGTRCAEVEDLGKSSFGSWFRRDAYGENNGTAVEARLSIPLVTTPSKVAALERRDE